MRAALVLAFLLSGLPGCKGASESPQAPPERERVMTMVFNFSGAPVMSASALNSAGGHGVLEGPVPHPFVFALGAGPTPRAGDTVTLQWIAGAGRLRWREAKLPIKIEQAGGDSLHLYLRPDGWVCASLLDRPHSVEVHQAPASRLEGDRKDLSCAPSELMPDLKPGAASGFELSNVEHSWSRHDRPGRSSVTYTQLHHKTGPVGLRFGEAFRGGPWYLNEFYWVRPLGDNAGLLVSAPLRPASPGAFVVTGDLQGWSSRFVGQTHNGDLQPLTETRQLLGSRLIIDTSTGVLYLLPHFPEGDGRLMGLSPDGRYAALHASTPYYLLREGRPNQARLFVMRLEDGVEFPVATGTLPSQAEEESLAKVRALFEACRWTNAATEPLVCR